MLAYEDKILSNKTAFISKLNQVSQDLQTDPNWLMAVMYKESQLNPAAQNTKFPLSGGPATGLIQFTPDTATSLGTSIQSLKAMSNVDQLDYVKSYLMPYKGKLTSYFNVYASVFFPAAIGKADDWVFEAKNISRSSVARQNPSLDFNKDGKITVAEFKQYVNNTIPSQLKNLVFKIKENPGTTALIVIGAVVLFYAFKKK